MGDLVAVRLTVVEAGELFSVERAMVVVVRVLSGWRFPLRGGVVMDRVPVRRRCATGSHPGGAGIKRWAHGIPLSIQCCRHILWV
ncbi:hypothetical protein [Rhodococcus sp. BH5]|uniref:hypothetical protein n=1 Tax=Rhodococcus sp. BH5 TaxID=2871702 RepID=UPI0022CD4946|nr:hypothetical protein [Rhodococcus sp. BH5]MCZ9634962.1 hypothetical protein [Rhodococcus sp. BH5]